MLRGEGRGRFKKGLRVKGRRLLKQQHTQVGGCWVGGGLGFKEIGGGIS